MYKIVDFTTKSSVRVPLKSIVVIVGPNNAGKSQLLKDIALHASGRSSEAKILREITNDFGKKPVDYLKDLVARLKPNNAGQYYLNSAGISLDDNVSIQYSLIHLQQYTQSDETARQHISYAFSRELLAYLTTEARLTFSKHRTNLYRPNQPGASSLVEALFEGSPEDESWLSTRTEQAFGLAVALDSFSSAGALEMRVATSFADLDRSDRSKARAYLQGCELLDQQGDGLRSFVATLGAVRSLHRDVFLIDEPEAFLHPPQAYQMGRALSQEQSSGKQIICATHSADFLRGVISVSTDVTIIRIARSHKKQVVRSLSVRPEMKLSDISAL